MLFSVNAPIVELLDEAQCLELDATLVERIYEFNSEATGYTDGQLLGGCVRADSANSSPASAAIRGEACASSRISG